MRLIEPKIIDDVFEALDRQIGVHGGVLLGLVVRGGTALSSLGLVMRTTNDVDVLGIVSENKNGLTIQRMTKFPDWLIKAADRVGRDFDRAKSSVSLPDSTPLKKHFGCRCPH